MMNKLTINWPDFLQRYWQKQPVVLHQAFKNFVDPIMPDELAGLALEEGIDSRLVSRLNQQWDARYGPFNENDFANLGNKAWSLLVQAVDHWHDQAAELVKAFNQFPQWQFDDLMISYAVPGGGVGPHIDHYDVFIIQGMGRRRWRVGDRNPNYKQFCAHPALLHVEDFTAMIDEELTAGDILYIPAGFPHDGVCLETSLSYSVGFRTPNAQELISSFADYLLEHNLARHYYRDPNLTFPEDRHLIRAEELTQIKQLMQQILERDEWFKPWFGQMITQPMHELNLLKVEPEYTVDEVAAEFQQGETCWPVNSLPIARIDEQYFVHGEATNLPAELMAAITQQQAITPAIILPYLQDAAVMHELTRLINAGYWYFSVETA